MKRSTHFMMHGPRIDRSLFQRGTQWVLGGLLGILVAAALATSGQATVVTSGNTSPGPSGTQADPWNTGLLIVGNSASGTLDISNGGQVNSGSGIAAVSNGVTGDITINDAGSLWGMSGSLTTGTWGVASLGIHNGGTLSVGTTLIAGQYSTGNSILVSGASGSSKATLTIGGDLILGGTLSGPGGGTAELIVGEDGVLEIGGYTYVYHGSVLDPGTDGFTTAGVHMRGGNLVAAVGGDGLHLDDVGFVDGWGEVLLDLHMGSSGLIDGFPSTPLVIHGQISGTGLITDAILGSGHNIGDAMDGNPLVGSLTIEDVEIESDATFTFGIKGAASSEYDKLLLGDNVQLDGLAVISFTDSFVPLPSDTFPLVEIGTAGVTGWFDQVQSPAGWELNSAGVLHKSGVFLVPEPAASLLLAFGLASLLLLRRRSDGSLRSSL